MYPSPSLKNRSFTLFALTQYFGAFNDNIFKQLILLLALIMSGHDRQGIAMMVFSLPFLLFSGYAGQLSEMYSKTTVMRLAKIAELFIMALGTLGFFLQSAPVLLVALFLMGTQSAFFGPAKYGAIPEIVKDNILLKANGVIQMTTFGAIILGIALAGKLMDVFRDSLHWAGLACMFISVIGIFTVYGIRPLKANRPAMCLSPNPFGRVFICLKEMKADKALWLALIASTFFYFSGGLVTQVINNYGRILLHLEPTGISLLSVSLAVGIMAGCLTAAPLQKRVGGKWTIVIGALGVALAEFCLYFYGLPLRVIHIILFAAGFFTGLYFVPIASFMQSRPPLGKKGEVLATVNFSNFIGIMSSGACWQGMVALGVSAHHAWLVLSGGLVILLITMFPHLQKIK